MTTSLGRPLRLALGAVLLVGRGSAAVLRVADCIGRALGLGPHACWHRPAARADRRAGSGSLARMRCGHRRVLLRHPVLGHLDDGMHLAAHVADRIDAALVLDGAGHLAAGPPHERGRRAGALDRAPPDAHVGPDVDAGAHDREHRVVAERDGDLAASLDAAADASASLVSAYSTIGGRGAAIMPTPIVALEALACSIMRLLLVVHPHVGRRLVEDLVPGRAEPAHGHAVPGRRLPHGLDVLLRHHPTLRSSSGSAPGPWPWPRAS